MPIADDVKIGRSVRIFHPDLVNLYGCAIGDETRIGAFVEIQVGATVGARCKISSHTFICEGVTIEDEVFVGHGVMFTNDRLPRATTDDGRLQGHADWTLETTRVGHRASIGSNATILCGLSIGEGATVGAGSVVTRSVSPGSVVAGVPARVLPPKGEDHRDDQRRRRGSAGAGPHSGKTSVLIPFLDLKAQSRQLKPEMDVAISRAIDSAQFVLGPEVKAFEERFASYCNVKHCVAVNSGTSALHLALLAAGIGAGDEVITVSMTFVATTAAILYSGAKPVFVDVDPVTWTMNPELIEAAITPRTKAIMPVHLHGLMAEMDQIMEIARRHGLTVIEDAAQAHGAEYKKRRSGSIGDLGCFSFYPGKNLGAYGEGGAVVSNHSELARRVSLLRDWGQASKYNHVVQGYNYRMDGIQGAVLNVKMNHIEAWTEARRSVGSWYDRLLQDNRFRRPSPPAHSRHVYHVYAVGLADRDVAQKALQAAGIGFGIHYPVPVHLQEAYAGLGYHAGDLPVTELLADQLLSLPIYAELRPDQVGEVVNTLASAGIAKSA